MARKIKTVFAENGVDRRDTGYYSTPQPVADYLFGRLRDLNPDGRSVVDPCIGKGELARPFIQDGLQVTGIDIFNHGHIEGAVSMRRDFISLFEQAKAGTLPASVSRLFQNCDYWIANPPYNCHESDYIQHNKQHLKTLFSDVGVHNMYAMFMTAMIDIARHGSLIGIVSLDSFLTARAHQRLRAKILQHCTIHDILLCPTELFTRQGADVRTCIIVLQKGKTESRKKIHVLNRTASRKEFYDRLKHRAFARHSLRDTLLDNDSDRQEFLIDVPGEIKALFQQPRIGQQYQCVTGISTGNDRKYISREARPGFTVPFYKNPGSRKFFSTPDGFLTDEFMNLRKRVPNFMVRNSRLLFKPGITCSSMGVEFSACYLPRGAVFGVNPNIICSPQDTWWLLAYLNSTVSRYMIRGVLIRTNMVTSGYVSRLPAPLLNPSDKNSLSDLAKQAFAAARDAQGDISHITNIVNEINKRLYDALALSQQTRETLDRFCADIIKST